MGCPWLCLSPAPVEDQLWCGKTLGEWGSGGSFQWQYHGAGRKPAANMGNSKQQLGVEQTARAQPGTSGQQVERTHGGFVTISFPAQYHALGLLYHVRKNDRLAVNKMLSKFTRHGLKSPFAYCMMIRVASKLLEEEAGRWEGSLALLEEFSQVLLPPLLAGSLAILWGQLFLSLKSSVQLLPSYCWVKGIRENTGCFHGCYEMASVSVVCVFEIFYVIEIFYFIFSCLL